MNLPTLWKVYKETGLSGVLAVLSLSEASHEQEMIIETLPLDEVSNLGVSKDMAESASVKGFKNQIATYARR